MSVGAVREWRSRKRSGCEVNRHVDKLLLCRGSRGLAEWIIRLAREQWPIVRQGGLTIPSDQPVPERASRVLAESMEEPSFLA